MLGRSAGKKRTTAMATIKKTLKIGCMNIRKTAKPKLIVALAKRLKYDVVILVDVNHKHQHTVSNTTSYHARDDFAVAIVQINTNLQINPIKKTKCMVAVELTNANRLKLCGYYIKPIDTQETQLVEQEIYHQLSRSRHDVIASGDSNAHHQSLGDETCSRGERIFNTISNFGCSLLNTPNQFTYTHFTRDAPTKAIDWTIATPRAKENSTWKIDERFDRYSDHRMCLIEVNLEEQIQPIIESIVIKPALFRKHIKQLANKNEIERWYEHLSTALQRSQVTKQLKEVEDFWTPQLQQEKQLLLDALAHRRWKRYSASKQQLEEIDEHIRRLNKAHKKNVQAAKTNYWVQQLKNTDDENVFDRIVKPSKMKDRNIVDRLEEPDNTINEPHEIATKILESFCPPRREIDAPFDDLASDEPDSPPFTVEEIDFAIHSMKTNKAPGDDRLSSDLIKIWFQDDEDYFVTLFNHWLERRIFPEQYKCSLIIPLIKNPKKGPSIGNFRCLGLLTHLAKIYEKLICNRLMHIAMTSNYFGKEQHGFRPAHGTVTALHRINKQRLKNYAQKRCELVASLDIAKAFDSITFRSIISALKDLKTPANLFDTMKSYFTNRQAKITINGCTVTAPVVRGVVQGSPLSAFLWICTFERIIRSIREQTTRYTLAKVCTTVYADDVAWVISAADGLERPIRTLQSLFAHTDRTLKEYGLQLATQKTQLMLTYAKKITAKVRLGEETVGFNRNIKILGLTFTNDLTFHQHLSNKLTEARAKYKSFTYALRKKDIMKKRVKEKLIQACIYPVVAYAAGIWYNDSDEHRTQIRTFNRTLVIQTTSAYNSTSHMASHIISNLIPLHYWVKLRYKVESRLLKGKTADGRLIEASTTIAHLPPPHTWSPKSEIIRINNTSDLQHINDQITIYTDGSKTTTDDTPSVGAAFVVYNQQQEIHHELYTLPTEATVYQAELTAINQACKYIETKQYGAVTILSDSLSAIQAIQKITDVNKIALEIRCTIQRLKDDHRKVTICWIKAHNPDFIGNNRADELANQARANGSVIQLPVPKATVKRAIKDKILEEINEEYLQSPWGRVIKQFVPQYHSILKKRLIINSHTIQIYTGHLPTLEYLHERKKSATNLCRCGQIQTVPHVITVCPDFIADNVTAALRSKLPAHSLLGPWEELMHHRRFHAYIAYRAKAIIAQLRRVNQYVSDCVDLHNNFSLHIDDEDQRNLTAERLAKIPKDQVVEGDLTGMYQWNGDPSRKRPQLPTPGLPGSSLPKRQRQTSHTVFPAKRHTDTPQLEAQRKKLKTLPEWQQNEQTNTIRQTQDTQDSENEQNNTQTHTDSELSELDEPSRPIRFTLRKPTLKLPNTDTPQST